MAADPKGPGDPTEATEHIGGAGRGERTLLVIGRSVVATSALPRRGALILGRSRSADLLIDDRTVSRRHARLVVDEDRITVEDLGSANGTRIGHQPVASEPAEVAVGQPFHLGAVTLVVEGPDGAQPAGGGARSTAVAPGAGGDPMAHLDALNDRPHIPDTSAGSFATAPPAHRRPPPANPDVAARLAAGSVSILIQGETGVGKERLAERIHALSPVARGPFVRLNCAAIAESLLESELFGHERGAFTGAVAVKPGLLEAASGGTLFLDEVGELPPSLQAKLLRAVEERAVRRVGAVEARPVEVRYVAATNRDLEDEVEAGRFRRDLYYRLAGATLYVAPLRERRGEIEDLARGFLEQAAEAGGRGRGGLSLAPDAREWLLTHDWPGNVRELRSACERAALLSDDGVVARRHFLAAAGRRAPTVPPPAPVTRPEADPADPAESLRETARREVEAVERRRILEALEEAGGNQTRAARLLGISRRTLINRLDAYGLPRPRKPR